MAWFDDHNEIQDTAEEILDEGLAYYERGVWDQAKEKFIQGLKIDPNHVDLLVHAGLSELSEKNYLLALSKFDMAIENGRRRTDEAIESDPDEYIKSENFEKWIESQVCELADECPDWNTDGCEDCDHNPKSNWVGLYTPLLHKKSLFFDSAESKSLESAA